MFKIRHTLIVVIAVLCAMIVTPRSHAQQSLWNTILSRTTQARDNAADARAHAADIRNEMQDALETLTGDMRSLIHDWVEEGERLIAEQKEGREEWLSGGGCGQFRGDIVAMLENMQTIFNQLSLMADPNAMPISFSDEIQLINQIDCRVLYPLFRTMNATNAFGEHMVELLQEGADALVIVGQIVAARYEDMPGSTLDYALNQTVNQFIINNTTAAEDAKHVVQGLGMVLKSVGKRLNAKAKSGVDTFQIEIWGWVGLTIKADEKSKWGEFLVGMSELLDKASQVASHKINQAIVLASLAEIRDNQLAILANQETMLATTQELLNERNSKKQ